MARQHYTSVKNTYCVGSTFTTSDSVEVSQADRKHSVVHAQCFPYYQLAFAPPHKQLTRNMVSTVLRAGGMKV